MDLTAVFLLLVLFLLLMFFMDYMSFKNQIKEEVEDINHRLKKSVNKLHIDYERESLTDIHETNNDEPSQEHQTISDSDADETLSLSYSDMNEEIQNDYEFQTQSENNTEDIENSDGSEYDFEQNTDEEDLTPALQYKDEIKENTNIINQDTQNSELNSFNLEKLFLGNLFNKIGAVAIIIAMCYFLSLVSIPPIMQIIISYIAALGFFTLSLSLKNKNDKYKNFSGVIMGISIAGMFIITYCGTNISGVIPEFLGMIMGIIVLIAAYYSAKLFDSVALIIIGLIGGYLTPFLVSHSGDINSQAVYFIIMNLVSAVYINRNTKYSAINNYNLAITACILFFSDLVHQELMLIYPIMLWCIYFVSEFISSLKDSKYSNVVLSVLNFIFLFILSISNEGIRDNLKIVSLIFLPLSICYYIISYLLNNNPKAKLLYEHFVFASVLITILYACNDLLRIIILLLASIIMIAINAVKKETKYVVWIHVYLAFALIFTLFYPEEGVKLALTTIVPIALIVLNKYTNTEKYSNMISVYCISDIILIALNSNTFVKVLMPISLGLVLLCTSDLFKIDRLKDYFKTDYSGLYFISALVIMSYCPESFEIFGYTLTPDIQKVYFCCIGALIITYSAKALKMNNYVKYGVSYVIASFFALLFVHGLYFVSDIANYTPVLNYRTCAFFVPVITAFICAKAVKDILPNVYNYLRFLALTGIYVYGSLELNLIITKLQGINALSDNMANMIKCMTLSMAGFCYTVNMLKLAKLTKFQLFEWSGLFIYLLSLLTIYIGCNYQLLDEFIPVFNIRVIAFLFAIAVTYCVSNHFKFKELQYLMPVIGMTLVFFETNDYLNKIYLDIPIITSAMIILYCACLIIVGIIRNNEIMKKSGIIMTDVILVKMLFFDILFDKINLDMTVKILVSLIIGALLLTVSFLYTKIAKK